MDTFLLFLLHIQFHWLHVYTFSKWVVIYVVMSLFKSTKNSKGNSKSIEKNHFRAISIETLMWSTNNCDILFCLIQKFSINNFYALLLSYEGFAVFWYLYTGNLLTVSGLLWPRRKRRLVWSLVNCAALGWKMDPLHKT